MCEEAQTSVDIFQAVRVKVAEKELNSLYLHYRVLNGRTNGEHSFITTGAITTCYVAQD